MAMLEAGVRKVADKHTLGEDDDSDDDSEDEEIDQTTSREATVINFLLVQPKSLQVRNLKCFAEAFGWAVCRLRFALPDFRGKERPMATFEMLGRKEHVSGIQAM